MLLLEESPAEPAATSVVTVTGILAAIALAIGKHRGRIVMQAAAAAMAVVDIARLCFCLLVPPLANATDEVLVLV